MIQVSVIIPVYNNEKTVAVCVGSVQQQTLKDIEIICVDDGSEDKSIDVLNNIAKNDERIRVFRKVNGGAASARNLGLEHSRGKYVIFLDADDRYLDKDALERMVIRCESCHVKVCGSIMSLEQNGTISLAANSCKLKQLSKYDCLFYEEFQWDYDFTTFLFAKELIVENQVRFPEINYYEDPPFLAQVLFYAEKFAIEDTCLYCYKLSQVVRSLSGGKCIGLLKGLYQNLVFANKHNLDILFETTLNRLEYEYGDWICNTQIEEKCLGEMLEKIQVFLLTNPKYDRHRIRIIEKIEFMQKTDYEDYLFNLITDNRNYYIYGNGKVSSIFKKYLNEKNWLGKCKGIVVSNKEDDDLDTYDIREFALQNANDLVFIAVSGIYIGEIVQSLDNLGCGNYEILDSVFLSKLECSL